MVKAWSVAADSPPGLIFRFASWQKVQLAQRSQAIRYYQSRKSLFAIMFVRVPLVPLAVARREPMDLCGRKVNPCSAAG